jgi:predicted nucleotidyltransferase
MVPMRDIKSAALKIAERFHPRRIILFGSHARGTADEHSDVDLLVLINGRGRRVHDKALEISLAIDFGFPLDLLTRSPEEFERRIGWGDHFLREIKERGITLYEAPDARMDRKGRRRFRNGAARSSSANVA